MHPDPHADIKKKWYEANLDLARTQKVKSDWFKQKIPLTVELL